MVGDSGGATCTREDTMKPANRRPMGEEELAAINARAEAALTYEDDAWDDVIRETEDDCASLCESLLSCAGTDPE